MPENDMPPTIDGRNPERPLDRRRFLTQSALMAMLAGVSVTIIGCDDDSPTAPTPGGSRSASILVNHGHSATISAAQLSGNAEVTLDIRGSADHPHTVVISVAELGQIAAGVRVTKTSSTDPSATIGTHGHQMQFN